MGIFERFGFGADKDKAIPELNKDFVTEEIARKDYEKNVDDRLKRDDIRAEVGKKQEAEKRKGETSEETAHRHGFNMGYYYGETEQVALRSGHKFSGTLEEEDIVVGIEKAKAGMSEEEMAAYDEGFEKGKKEGRARAPQQSV